MYVVRSREWSDVVIMCDGAQLGSSAHWPGWVVQHVATLMLSLSPAAAAVSTSTLLGEGSVDITPEVSLRITNR